MKSKLAILVFFGFGLAQAATYDNCQSEQHSEKGTANVQGRTFVEKGSFNDTQRLVVETQFGQGTFATAGFYLMDVSGTKPQYYFLFDVGTNDGELPEIIVEQNKLTVSGDIVINAAVEIGDKDEPSQSLYAPDILGTFETTVQIKGLEKAELKFDLQDCHSTNKNGGL